MPIPNLSDSDYHSLTVISGLSDGVIRSRGYWTATNPEQLTKLGFPDYQATLVPALVVPVWSVDGGEQPVHYQIRPHNPRLSNSGKPIKYETLAGLAPRLDVPPSIQPYLGNPKEPLWITEGSKKADAAAERGLVCVCLTGVWNWRGSNEFSGITELSDWDRIALKGRTVYVAFDNDVMSKPSVRLALTRLANMLRRRGSVVHAVVLPQLGQPPECKIGLDDYFVLGGKMTDLDSETYVDDTLLSDGQIDLFAKSLTEITTKALEALVMSNDPPHIFVRSGQLVRVSIDERGIPVIQSMNTGSLRNSLANAAHWTRKGQAVYPPKEIVESILNMSFKEWEGIPPIVSVSTTPVLGNRAKISAHSGYDPDSACYVAPGSNIVPFDGSAKEAAAWIFNEVLGDFPFDGEPDRAHALALMLLPILRPFINGPTPLHLIDAPVQGTGKSLLAKLALMPTQGEHIAILGEVTNEEEWRKKISTKVFSGSPYVFLDNLTGKIASASLAGVLTTRIWEDRYMATMQLMSGEIRQVWVATANNASLSRDIVRRTVWIRLNARMERPDDRTAYRHEYPEVWVRKQRGVILGALIRIVELWAQTLDGNTSEQIHYSKRKLGSYEAWSAVMGSVLDYCHVPGLLGNIDELRVAADNESAAYSEFYDRWWTVHGRTSVRVAEVLDLFKQDESLAGMVGDRGELSQANRLGRVLNSLVDVVHGGKRIVRVTGRGNANRFRCELLPLNTDLYGENGGPIINDPKYNGTANHVIKPVEVGDGLLPTLDTRLLGSGPQTASDGNSQMADGAGGAGKAPFWVDLD